MNEAQLPKLRDFEVLRCLARGGMAEVHLARVLDGWLRDTEVILKRLQPVHAHDHAFVELFVAEARLGELLVHPNIAQTFEIIHRGDELFIVQEYVDGCTLGVLLEAARGGVALPIPARLAAFRDLLRALGALQDRARRPDGLAVIHRDVNPENVIVRRDGVAKLIDFGVSEVEGEVHEERAGALRGTPAYMSPEQAKGRVLDIRSDVFSAGIVLWELLAGRPLFREATHFETLRRICEENPPAVSTASPKVPPAFDAIVAKALAREREERYPTAAALGEAIDEAMRWLRWEYDVTGLAKAVGEVAGPVPA